MPVFKPFKAYRPKPEFAAKVAAKPYDVLSSEEARIEAKDNPLSFLHVGKPEIDLDPSIDLYDPRVYEKGRENLMKFISDGILEQDPEPYFYLWAQTMGNRTQIGLVGCASVDDYWNDKIKKHEKTRKDKEEDRCNHVRVTNAHTGPIFLTYRDNPEIDSIVAKIIETQPIYDFISEDNVRQRVWVIKDKETIDKIQNIFERMDCFYVADGHHRSAAAAIVGRERQQANPNHRGDEEYNYFLAVLFPASHLMIMDYNRVVKDLNGNTKEEFINKISKIVDIEEQNSRFKPTKKGEIGMYLDGKWYKLTIKPEYFKNDDPVERLDISILQNHILAPILGIDDPRTSKRIDFIGGIRGLEELEKRVNSGDWAVAFAMYPTSIDELMQIADAGKIMPPKSTWFEPKLKDGLFVHFLD
ncbi:MAG: hypothetical protein CH6_2617 [Candidatus Kapaibacterium sp.]|nr:MAG: hypothetical protein CH6_2617 [Candidatus Kapabacteria bacterium]